MAYEIKQSARFESDFNHIATYMLIGLHAFNALERLMGGIDNMASVLGVTPYIKAISTKPFLQARELREYSVLSYVVLYRIEGETVMLTNIFHQTQEYDSARYWETAE